MNAFLIGAATSGSGKTTLTMGLLRALTNRGLRVQPFKCGPDYIDPMFHQLAAQRESINLDTWLSPCEHVRELFQKYSQDADMCVVEGVMGLYDGHDSWHGSSAALSILLDLPVILVVNAKSTAYSVAPFIHGFKTFVPDSSTGLHIRLAGVIFNRVGSEHHFRLLKQACEDTGVICFGYIENNPSLSVPERFLGLTIPVREKMEHLMTMAADEVEKHIDITQIINL